jgi:hypothetical protein
LRFSSSKCGSKLDQEPFFPNLQIPTPKLQRNSNFSIINQHVGWMRELLLEVSLDVVSLEFGIYEIVLAGETGANFLFVVGLHRGRPDQLDRRAQLCCAK